MNKKSFTLIELLVVIAIIGILSSLVIARFSDWGDNARIANTLQWSAGIHRTLGANLVGHWDFNDDSSCSGIPASVRDLSGYNNHGTVSGASWDGDTPNNDGCSLSFNGSNNYIEIEGTSVDGNNPINLDNDFTISFWFYPVESKSSYIIGNYEGHGDYLGNSILMESDIEGLGVDMGIHIDDNAMPTAFSTGELELNQWYHILATRNKGVDVKIYVNGSEENTSNDITTGSVLSNQNWFIGRRSQSVGEFFNGLINEVRIYDTALTAEEVGRIYAESKDSYLVYE